MTEQRQDDQEPAAQADDELGAEQLEQVGGGYTLIELLPVKARQAQATRSSTKLAESVADGKF